MKQILSWVILVLFLTNIGGFFYVFKAKEYAIKKEIKTKIKQGVAKDELHTFTITDNNSHQFEWEHSKEFKFNGMMYDVVYRTNNSDGSVTLECVSDIQETILFKELDQYLAKNIMSRNNGKHPIVEFHFFLSQLYCSNDSTKMIDVENQSSLLPPLFTDNYKNPFSSTEGLPPEYLG